MSRELKHPVTILFAALTALLAACETQDSLPTGISDAESQSDLAASAGGRTGLVERGRRLFFDETFGGNGRTCGTCHPTPTLVLTPSDIAALPPDDPFFAGTMDMVPEMAARGLIRYPLGGPSLFEPDVTVFRSIPTIRNVRQTGPFTADGRGATLQEQAAEATLLHLLDGAVDRPGERMPTAEELDAIAAFEMAMSEPESGGRGLHVDASRVREGRRLFFGRAACATCHVPPLFTDNAFHNIVAGGDSPPVDPGRCRLDPSEADCWSGTAFNTPQLRGVVRTAPYFHDNSLPTLRAVVEFYDSPAFSASPAAVRLRIGPLELKEGEIDALVAYLETL